MQHRSSEYRTPALGIRGRSRISGMLTLCCGLALAPNANAAFVGSYLASNWLLANTNADGSSSAPDTLTLILTGGNNGSGTSGTTDFVINAAANGTVTFDFSYFAQDDLTFDFAGYLLNGVFTKIADNPIGSGTGISFVVTQGQLFGFRVATADNTGNPGILTVTNFSAPDSSVAAVPEPSTAPMLFLLLAGAVVTQRWMTRAKRRKSQLAYTSSPCQNPLPYGHGSVTH
jgi:hypothetical protein